jgi:exosortase
MKKILLNFQPPRLRILEWVWVAALLAVFYPVFKILVESGWEKADYTHAYFILPIFVWLLCRNQSQLVRKENAAFHNWLILIAACILFVFSRINRFLFLETFSFVLFIWAFAAFKWTPSSLRGNCFPLAYLLFLIPPPRLVMDSVTMPLKLISTQASFTVLKLLQVPVVLNGAILEVGGYELFVADACSGYRSIVTLLALGSLYAYLQKTTLLKKWLIFASTVPIGLAANIFRIVLTGGIAKFFGLKYAEGFFHEFSGALVFLIGIFGLIKVSDILVGHDR